MKIYDSVNLDVDRSVGGKVGRGSNCGSDSDVGDEVAIIYGEGVE